MTLTDDDREEAVQEFRGLSHACMWAKHWRCDGCACGCHREEEEMHHCVLCDEACWCDCEDLEMPQPANCKHVCDDDRDEYEEVVVTASHPDDCTCRECGDDS